MINDGGNQLLSGAIFGDPLASDSIKINGNQISFVRVHSEPPPLRQNAFRQTYFGTAVSSGGGVDSTWTILGMFTHTQNGQVSGPFTWMAHSGIIPG
jgi:hypothetical protein